MRKQLCVLILIVVHSVAIGGNRVQFTGRQFSFSFVQPDEWSVDSQAAAQIAHLVIHERGTSWRNADAVIFGRFVPRHESESAEEFLHEDEQRLQLECPLAEIRKRPLDLTTSQQFLIKEYRCPGTQNEIVAVATLPSFFAMFVLSSRDGRAPESRLDAFQVVLNTFEWTTNRDDPYQGRGPRPPLE